MSAVATTQVAAAGTNNQLTAGNPGNTSQFGTAIAVQE